MPTKPALRMVPPATQKRTVPIRRPNAALRTREYLTEVEIGKLMRAASKNRHGHRDATMILVAYRHGLRAVELVDLRWDQIDFNSATMAVRRSRKVPLPRIPSWAMNCEPYVGYSGSKSQRIPLCSPVRGEHRSPAAALPRWWNGQGRPPSSASRFTRTCCAMPVGLHSPTRATIPAAFRPISGTGISNTRLDIRS
jgi:hypothetical protein